MKTKPAILTSVLILGTPCLADKFTMKDGTVLDGDVLKETPDSLVLNVKVTKSIRDEKSVKKSDIVKREKVDPAVEIFESTVGPLLPVPDFSNDAEYDRRLKTVGKFLKDYPDGEMAKAAKAIEAKLKEESNLVNAGGIKTGGKVISQEEYNGDRYEIDARALGNLVATRIARGDVAAALRDYAKMGAEFPNTAVYCSLAPALRRAAAGYIAQVGQLERTFEARQKKRQDGLSQMSSRDRAVTERAIAEENALLERRFKEEKEARIGWVSIDPNHLDSLKETVTQGPQELTKLEAIPAAPSPDAGEAYRKAARLIAQNAKPEEISTAISELRTAKVPDSYIARLESKK